jgi:hypothetical protein
MTPSTTTFQVGGGAPVGGAPPASNPQDPDGLTEVVHEGAAYRVPPALKDGLMNRADYVQKIQDLAHHQRTWQQQRASEAELDEAISHLRAMATSLDAQIAPFEQLDWHGLAASDPDQAAELWRLYQELKAALDDVLASANQAAQHHAAQGQQEHAQRLAHGHAVLARDLPGWSPALAAQLAGMGQTEFGFSPQELSQVTDPRLIKLLHRACVATIAAKGRNQVARLAAGQKTQPAQAVRGGAGRAVAADTNDFAAFERLAGAKLRQRP